MNKIERIEAVLKGDKPDRLPVSFWYHFGVQHGRGSRYAELALDFFRYYDLDWLKLMNDYYHPMPKGLTEVKTGEDLKKIRPLNIKETDWKEQLEAVEVVAKELNGKAYFIDTVFEPWQTLQRNLAGEHLPRLAEEEPDALIEALDVVTENLIAYCNESLKRGSAGIFLSSFAAESEMDRGNYLKFAKPFVVKIFNEIGNLGIMNTIHAHGTGVYVDDLVDIPAQIINYEDRHPSNPSLGEMKRKFGGILMGGIDKKKFTRLTPAGVRENGFEALRQAGDSKVLLAPGCSVPNWFYPESAKLLVKTIKSAGR